MVIIPVGHFLGARSWNKDLGCSPTSHLKWGTSAPELEKYVLYIYELSRPETTVISNEKTYRYCVEATMPFNVSNRCVPTLGWSLSKVGCEGGFAKIKSNSVANTLKHRCWIGW